MTGCVTKTRESILAQEGSPEPMPFRLICRSVLSYRFPGGLWPGRPFSSGLSPCCSRRLGTRKLRELPVAFQAHAATIFTSREAASRLAFKVIAVCTLTALWIAEVGAQQALPTPSTLSAEQIVCGPENAEIVHTPMSPIAPVPAASMLPAAALEAYQRQAEHQISLLQEYSVLSVIHVELLDTLQDGVLELRRHYVAPRTLEFTAIRFTGDTFVKNNVILRLLQSEVDYLHNERRDLTAINNTNYKVSYKMTGLLEGRSVHIYELKPRKKRFGLFKGRMFLDAFTGELVRSDGEVVKSPSMFVKKIEFVQDYVQVEGITFLAHARSVAKTRLIGRVVVDIYHHDYRPVIRPDTYIGEQAMAGARACSPVQH